MYLGCGLKYRNNQTDIMLAIRRGSESLCDKRFLHNSQYLILVTANPPLRFSSNYRNPEANVPEKAQLSKVQTEVSGRGGIVWAEALPSP